MSGRNTIPGGFRVAVVDGAPSRPASCLSYGDAGTPGNVSDPVTVGFGGWQVFAHVFAGRDAAGQDRIYAVDPSGQCLCVR